MKNYKTKSLRNISSLKNKNLPLDEESENRKSKEIQEEKQEYEDPALLRKQGILYLQKKDISYYRKLIVDEKYMDHAINRIAMELMHFILKDR